MAVATGSSEQRAETEHIQGRTAQTINPWRGMSGAEAADHISIP
jgi:hypothetical protein